MTVFSGLDPDKLSNGLMWFGCPERLSFSISYAYRVLPMLMEGVSKHFALLPAARKPTLPGGPVGKGEVSVLPGEGGHARLLPLMLNNRKRSRTTVEALEIRGYRNAAANKAVKRMKLATLKVSTNDLLFLAISLMWDFPGHSAFHFDLEKRYPLETGFSHHGKLAKRLPFSTVYTDWLFGEAKNAGLDALCLTEHFNTLQFDELYGYLSARSTREGDALVLENGLRVFPAWRRTSQREGTFCPLAR